MDKPFCTPQEFAEIMEARYKDSFIDEEYAHRNADGCMCELLKSLGYHEGIEIFKKMSKWYA